MSTLITASGPSLFDAAFLGHANDAYWVGVVKKAPSGSKLPLDIGIRLGTKLEQRDLWRDPGGGLWVVGEGGVRTLSDPYGQDADVWEIRVLDAELRGITGVDARTVVTWGDRPSDGSSVLRTFNGARWNPQIGPGFRIEAVHLTSLDRMWVVGDGVARFDGEGWDVLDLTGVIAVHAPTDDLVVVVCEDGSFGRITPDGYERIGVVDGARAVAVFDHRVWIGAGENGLWRAGGGELVQVREDRPCVHLEVHDDGLLVACTDVVCSTTDGERFPAGVRGYLDAITL